MKHSDELNELCRKAKQVIIKLDPKTENELTDLLNIYFDFWYFSVTESGKIKVTAELYDGQNFGISDMILPNCQQAERINGLKL